MAGKRDREVTDPTRLRQFTTFFRRYMSLSTVIVAALPVPAAYLRMIPMHEPDRASTSVITSLLCFLLLSFIFYDRHRTAKILFYELHPRASSPPPRALGADEGGDDDEDIPPEMMRTILSLRIAFLIAGTAMFFLAYQFLWISKGATLGAGADQALVRLGLMLSYVGFFCCAEAAFVLMATREYLQDLLGLSDTELIRGRRPRASAAPDSGQIASPPVPPGDTVPA